MNIAVAGTEYVGLSLAVLLSQHNDVTAVDIIPEKVEKINNWVSPIQDEYIEKYMAEHEERKLSFKATTDGASAYKDAEFIIVAAPINYDPNTFLSKGVSNSNVIYDYIKGEGYTGGLTTLKEYISSHKHLLPPKRQSVSSQGNRGRRYKTNPGEAYQMDWGFVNVDNGSGGEYRAACFAMVCHHCGKRFIEFFPNARQESLFIGMLHGFEYMGVPEYVLTDNMKSVVIGRDEDRHPIWQKDYEVFMDAVGFKTKLCKPRHPFTKGKVERLVRFVKTNFLAYRTFSNITELPVKSHLRRMVLMDGTVVLK